MASAAITPAAFETRSSRARFPEERLISLQEPFGARLDCGCLRLLSNTYDFRFASQAIPGLENDQGGKQKVTVDPGAYLLRGRHQCEAAGERTAMSDTCSRSGYCPSALALRS